MPVRVRLALMVGASLVLLGALGFVLLGSSGSAAPTSQRFEGSLRPPIEPQDFTLSDQDGKRVSLSDFRGEPLILTFMYSNCQDTCPTLASQIRIALDDLGDDAVPALAISVDPANDTAASAKSFLLERRVLGRMRFLLGERSQLTPIWKAYGIQPQGDGFEHSAYVLLIDAQGRQRISFPVSQLTPEGLTHDVRALRAESAQAASAAAAASARSTAAL